MKKKQIDNLDIRIFNDLKEISIYAADLFKKESERAIDSKGFFTVSLSGGMTPKLLFKLLGADYKNNVFWGKTYIFWGDERERKENPESSFYQANEIWLSKIIEETPSFKDNIYRIKMELGLGKGAEDYTKKIEKWAPEGFDLCFSGAGADGHRNGVMPENEKWKNKIWDLSKEVKVFGSKVPQEINSYTERVTLTPWFLNKSKINILMLSGKGKSELLKKITVDKEKYTKEELPAITFNNRPTIILTDKAAASAFL